MSLTASEGLWIKLVFAGLASIPVSLTAIRFNAIGVKDPFLLIPVSIGAVLVLTASWNSLTKQTTPSTRFSRKSKTKTLGEKAFYRSPIRCALITLTVFGLIALVPHVLTMLQVLKFSYEIDAVYNFVLFENMASILTAFIVLNWNNISRPLKR